MHLTHVPGVLPTVAATTARPVGPTTGLDSFGRALLGAVAALDELQQQADTAASELATGDSVDLHDVMLAQERASLSLELAVQVRNKLVEAYQEIMRMQV